MEGLLHCVMTSLCHDPLPDNRCLSQRRLHSLLKRLSQKPEQLDEYDRVIKDQLDKGIIERNDQSQAEKSQPCHLIHISY